jgi:hypothetical protein
MEPVKAEMKLKAPVFIVGCGHSGTSILLSILAAHSGIYAVPFESNVGFKSTSEANRLITDFSDQAVLNSKQCWVEKTPTHIRCIESLRNKCPGARFILIIRDGRDVACSIFRRTGDIHKGISRWINDNRRGQKYWNDSDLYVIKYEDLITSVEMTLRRVTDFLSLNFEKSMIEYYKYPRFFYSDTIEKPPSESVEFHNQYRNWQINQKIFDGRGKWRELDSDKIDLIKQMMGRMLIEYGYTQNFNW